MKIAIGNDHTGVSLKKEIQTYLEAKGHEVVNCGTDNTESYDYPLAGVRVSQAVVSGEAEVGIAICGTGIGISLSCNKVKGIRCAVCSEPYSAMMARRHNDANIIAFGARVVGVEMAKMIVDSYLESSFEGERHSRRVGMIMDIEERESHC